MKGPDLIGKITFFLDFKIKNSMPYIKSIYAHLTYKRNPGNL